MAHLKDGRESITEDELQSEHLYRSRNEVNVQRMYGMLYWEDNLG